MMRLRMNTCVPRRRSSSSRDLRRWAALRLETAGDGTRAEVAWSLQVHSAPLRVAAHVAYPLMRWGRDRVSTWRSPDFAGERYRARRELRNHVPTDRGAPPTRVARSTLRTRTNVALSVSTISLVRPGQAGRLPQDDGACCARREPWFVGESFYSERAMGLPSRPARSGYGAPDGSLGLGHRLRRVILTVNGGNPRSPQPCPAGSRPSPGYRTPPPAPQVRDEPAPVHGRGVGSSVAITPGWRR
jgi:hypothetical protein